MGVSILKLPILGSCGDCSIVLGPFYVPLILKTPTSVWARVALE